MGKKKPEEMAKQRDVFVGGATSRGVEEATGHIHLRPDGEVRGGTGSTSRIPPPYALLSYQTAWLKAHHPAAFMAAVLSADMDSTDKVVNFVEESRALGLTNRAAARQRMRPPVQRPPANAASGTGLGAIKGVG